MQDGCTLPAARQKSLKIGICHPTCRASCKVLVRPRQPTRGAYNDDAIRFIGCEQHQLMAMQLRLTQKMTHAIIATLNSGRCRYLSAICSSIPSSLPFVHTHARRVTQTVLQCDICRHPCGSHCYSADRLPEFRVFVTLTFDNPSRPRPSLLLSAGH